MIVDAVALAICCGFGYLGWRRGTLTTALWLLGLFAGYLAAFFLYRPVGGLLVATGKVPLVIAYPLAGLLTMFVVSLSVRIVRKRIVAKRRKLEHDGWEPSDLDRAGGAVIAGAVAVAVVSLVAWGATAIAGLSGRPLPALDASYTGRVGAAAAEKTVFAAMRLAGIDGRLASSLSAALARPAKAASALRSMTQSELFQRLKSDPSFKNAFLSGDAGSLAGSPMMGQMMQDESFQQAFDAFNLNDWEGTSSGDAAERLASGLAPFGGSMGALRSDQQLGGLATELQNGVSTGGLDLVQLVKTPRLSEMLEKINSSYRAQERAVNEVIR